MSHKNYIQKKEEYFCDYPTRPIGGGNPYYCCRSCGRSDPEINGQLSGHGFNCLWAIEKYGELMSIIMGTKDIDLYSYNRGLDTAISLVKEVLSGYELDGLPETLLCGLEESKRK